MSDSKSIRQFPNGARVVLILKGNHPKNGHVSTIVGALQNPSGRPENQWYDVRFDDNALGRFAGRYLASANTEQTNSRAASSAA